MSELNVDFLVKTVKSKLFNQFSIHLSLIRVNVFEFL